LGLTVQQASLEIARLKHFFEVLPEQPLLAQWERLVSAHQVSGKNGGSSFVADAASKILLTLRDRDTDVRVVDVPIGRPGPP
jgi:hypothetical protein